MAKSLGSVEWIQEFIPDVANRLDPFIVDTEDVDDELIEVFLEELQRLSGEAKEGLATGDGDMVRMAAHSIKGMGGTIGLPEISVLGLQIEMLAKEDCLPSAVPMVDELVNWVDSL